MLLVVSMMSVAVWKSWPLRRASRKSGVVSVLPRAIPCWSHQAMRTRRMSSFCRRAARASAASCCSAVHSSCFLMNPI